MAEDQQLFGVHQTFQAEFLDVFLVVTVLLHFWAHAPTSEHAPLLEYRRTEVNCNIYNIAAPTFQSILKTWFFGYMRSMHQKRDNTVWQSEIYTLLTLDIMSSNPRHKVLI